MVSPLNNIIFQSASRLHAGLHLLTVCAKKYFSVTINNRVYSHNIIRFRGELVQYWHPNTYNNSFRVVSYNLCVLFYAP